MPPMHSANPRPDDPDMLYLSEAELLNPSPEKLAELLRRINVKAVARAYIAAAEYSEQAHPNAEPEQQPEKAAR